MAHLKSFCVLQVWEERLDKMALFGRDDNDIRLAVQGGKHFEFFELRPVSDI